MLSGVKILSFTHYLQGPYAAQTLADLGADVVKIERPQGGAYERSWSGGDTYLNGVSAFFLLVDRNQRSLAVDLKSEQGRELIYHLVKTYDVVITNFRPGVMDKLGFSYEALRAVNPRVIYCSCTGWGESGPYLLKDGQDILAQSVSGLISQNGPGDRPPYGVGATVADVHGGSLAAVGVLAALVNRDRTGRGHKIESNLLNAALDLQMESLGYYLNTKSQPDRASTGLSTRIHAALYGVYKTKDGLITINCRDEEKIKKAFGENAFEGVESTFKNRFLIDGILGSKVADKTTAEWIELFEAHKIRYAEVNEYPQVVKNAQVLHNGVFLEMDHPVAGKVYALNHANRYDGDAPQLRRLPPGVGQHSKEILREIGYSAKQIKALEQSGVIGSESTTDGGET